MSDKLDPRKNTLDKKGNLRVDFLFSYWLVGWFILYYFQRLSRDSLPSKNTPLTNTQSPISAFIRKHLNPKLGFYLAIIENILTLITLIYYGSDVWTIFKYMCMMLLLKVLPLYLLMDYHIQWIHDSFVLISIFVLYNIYLWVNETNLYEIYKRTFISIKENKNETPLFSVINQILHV